MLVYTTEPLAADVEVTGPVELVLHAASSAVETDFTATLIDVHPGGKAIHLCEGIVRTCFRDSYQDPIPIEPDQVYVYRIAAVGDQQSLPGRALHPAGGLQQQFPAL